MFNDIINKKENKKTTGKCIKMKCSNCKYSGADGAPKTHPVPARRFHKSLFEYPCNKCNKYEYWKNK